MVCPSIAPEMVVINPHCIPPGGIDGLGTKIFGVNVIPGGGFNTNESCTQFRNGFALCYGCC